MAPARLGLLIDHDTIYTSSEDTDNIRTDHA